MNAAIKSSEDVKRFVGEHDIQFIRLQFADIFGIAKNVAITTKELDKALANEIMFDGSSIEGFVRIEESDMFLRPDISTLAPLPWLRDYGVARMICDIYKPDGTPFEGDPRYILKRAVGEARSIGREFQVGPECEFFLFQTDPAGRATTHTHDEASYFDLAPIDNGETARIDMVKTLLDMGFSVEASHHESAPGQHEIDFMYSDALRAADNIMTFKLVVKVMAKKNNLHATFMPKPIEKVNGSGMHCNMSLFKNGENAFYDENAKYQLSRDAVHFIGGLLTHAKGIAALTNPVVNSYKRLVPGYEAPVYISWSMSNRSPLIRVPVTRGTGTRIELRNPDPSCNPYLALAAMLTAGLDGIKNRIEPPAPVNGNVYDLSPEEMERSGIEPLPDNLDAAIDELLKDDIAAAALGPHILENYIKAKRIEWDEYKKTVHGWEINKYLNIY